MIEVDSVSGFSNGLWPLFLSRSNWAFSRPICSLVQLGRLWFVRWRRRRLASPIEENVLGPFEQLLLPEVDLGGMRDCRNRSVPHS